MLLFHGSYDILWSELDKNSWGVSTQAYISSPSLGTLKVWHQDLHNQISPKTLIKPSFMIIKNIMHASCSKKNSQPCVVSSSCVQTGWRHSCLLYKSVDMSKEMEDVLPPKRRDKRKWVPSENINWNTGPNTQLVYDQKYNLVIKVVQCWISKSALMG